MSIFDRNVPGMTEVLRRSSVGIAGCGGLGSNAALALTRAGIGRLILADFDKVEESNLNRQQFTRADIGKPKVATLARNLKAINPDLRVDEHSVELSPANLAGVFREADLLIEAFDKAEAKKWLVATWCQAFPGRHVVCGNGLAGYGGNEALKVTRLGDFIWFCGDNESDMSLGLCSARVAIAANMEANLAIELLMKHRHET
ncbi:MAG: sulfur carrier protein ThiS adenylyltransferase ThiF [Elusimicrobia bacterium]|nr:sulfur carrier protein ThiS adenylyltransferase ThiF [Elusimicrobiota bacterium]